MTIGSSKVKQEIRTDIPEAILQEATYCELGGQLQKHSRTMLIDKNWHTRNDFARGNLLQVGGSVAK